MPTNYQPIFSKQLLETKDTGDALIAVIKHYQATEADVANSAKYKDNLSKLIDQLEDYIIDENFKFQGELPHPIHRLLEHAKLVQKHLYRNYFDLSLSSGMRFKQALIDTLKLLYETEFEKDNLTGEHEDKVLSADSDTFLSFYPEWLEGRDEQFFNYDLKALGFEQSEHLEDLDLFEGLLELLNIAKLRYQTHVMNEETGDVALSGHVIRAENAVFASGHDIKVIYQQMVELERSFLDKKTEKVHKKELEKTLNLFRDKMDEKLAEVIVSAGSIAELKDKTDVIYAPSFGEGSIFAVDALRFKNSIIQSVEIESAEEKEDEDDKDKENKIIPFLERFYQVKSLAKQYDLINTVPDDIPAEILEHIDDAIVRKAFESCQKLIDHATNYNYFADPAIDDLRAEPRHEDAMTVEKIFAAIRARSETEWAPLYAGTDLHVELKNRLDACENLYQNWQDYLVLRQDMWVLERGTEKESLELQPVYLKKVFSERYKKPHDNPADLLAQEQALVEKEAEIEKQEAQRAARVYCPIKSLPAVLLVPDFERQKKATVPKSTESESSKVDALLYCDEELDFGDEQPNQKMRIRQ
tara:strand:+ start:10549 stop:12303 length:1755 start_codon:yes stop_codon:yes gene_type:complete